MKFTEFLRLRLSACICVAAILCMWSGCKQKPEYRSSEGVIWHTMYHATYQADADYSDSIIEVLRSVERSVSVFTPGSVVCRINDNSGLEADSIFSRVYRKSREIWGVSEGYFDPTLSPLISAYGFAGKRGELPDGATVDSLLGIVGLGRTSLTGGTLHKEDPCIQFNFSAIAKGYGCDAVGEMFRRNGCADYLVEIGGEIAVSGRGPRGGQWNVQIDKPVFSADSIVHDAQLAISVTDCGIATSGNYRNYREEGGRRLGHTIDPRTGAPAVNDMLSATVVAPTCMEADAYATACMAMGFDRARAMAERHGLTVLLIADGGRMYQSPSFARLVINQ